jgi:hypothetical protein
MLKADLASKPRPDPKSISSTREAVAALNPAVDASPAVTPASSPSTVEEDAFFERGLLEERATLESMSRQSPQVRSSAGPGRARAAAAVVAALAVGTAALSVGLLRPRSKARAIAAPAVVAAPVEPPAAAVFSTIVVPPVAPAPAASDGPDQGAPAACRAAVLAKRFREMLSVCDAAASGPDGASLALLVANAELERGHATSARRWARRAIERDPALAEAYVIIGSVDQQAGRDASARAAYARYLALAPTGKYAAELRAISARR